MGTHLSEPSLFVHGSTVSHSFALSSMAGLSFQCQCLVWQAVEKEAHSICIIDVLSLAALQQLYKPFKPEDRGVGVHSSTLPNQFLKYQAVALIEVGDPTA
jgi:hypothetical protein